MVVRRAEIQPEGQAVQSVLRLESCTFTHPLQGPIPGLRPRYADGSVGPCRGISADPAVNQAGEAIGDVLGWTVALGKLLTKLLDPVTYVRIAEFIVGAVLILMALGQFGKVLGVSLPLPGVAGKLMK